MPGSNDTYWRRKLSAYMHDPPEKALDLAWHKDRAEAHQSGQGLEETEFVHSADHTAAAADRLPWPTYRHLECRFDGQENYFRHPLGRACLKIPPFSSADLATDKAWQSRPLLAGTTSDPSFDHRAQFFAYWRLWRWWASDQRHPRDPRLAFLPADTRLPDHTIWAHNSLVSALQGCVEDGECRPAFLLFQLGPVQEYIAQARRTLDLWSGSYLLSYLMGSGLSHLALSLGPDHVIFPNLCGQPILDLLLKDEVWARASVQEENAESKPRKLWDSLGYGDDYARLRLLIPSLPNRFLAIVPVSRATEIATEVERTIRRTYASIAEAVWNLASEKLTDRVDPHKDRFFAQSRRLLDISWQTLPWPQRPAEALDLTAHLPKFKDADFQSGLQSILDLASKTPLAHRDVRNFDCERFPDGKRSANGRAIGGWKDKSKLKDDAKLDNPGAAWSALYAQLNWQLDAVRQTRAWTAWNTGGWSVGIEQNKDSLNGREEAILNLASDEVKDEEIDMLIQAFNVPHLFKKGEILGATTLIKRLWPTAWLQPTHQFSSGDFSMPDTRDVADGRPFTVSGDADKPGGNESKSYFAVIAFDGDEMGKWVSGTHPNMPRLREQLAHYTEGGRPKGARIYFEDNSALKPLLDQVRPLTPSFHLQLSEMLATFSNVCARRIVEAFDGRLIYSGGDDVLALLPADRALRCAQALRAAFRGDPDVLKTLRGAWQAGQRLEAELFADEQPGFIRLHPKAPSIEGEPKGFPAIVPGPAADCSVGIAIAHFKSPLQDVVRAAQVAEKRAKNQLGRSAVAVTLFKRSGETVEWGCKWEGGGLEIYQRMATALKEGKVSSRLPYRLVGLLEVYLTAGTALSAKSFEQAPDFDVGSVIEHELRHVIERQGVSSEAKTELRRDWLETAGGPQKMNLLRRFLHWTHEQEACAAALKLAERLKPLIQGGSGLDRLKDLSLSSICESSMHQQTFRAIAQEFECTRGSVEIPKAAKEALLSFDRKVVEAQLKSMIGLCQTVAFAHRTRSAQEPKAERQRT